MTFDFQGLLFDLDGTLIDSLAAVERAWATWAVEHGLDPHHVVPRIHGRRAIDSIQDIAPDLDAQTAFSRIEHLEATDTDGVVATVGAIEFVAQLRDIPWGIVTSGTAAIALPRLAAAGIDRPEVFVTADEVSQGKPDPAPFLEGSRRLGIEPSQIIAFEDTLAGIRSARSAGITAIALTSAASEGASARIEDFRTLQILRKNSGYQLTLL